MAEVLQEFLTESRELLEKLDRDLLELEKTPTNGTLLGSIFRCVHTIKGNSSFLGFSNLQALTHAGENLLSALRAGRLRLSPAISGALFELIDASRAMIEAIASGGSDAGVETAAIRDRLARLADAEVVEAPAEPAAAAIGDAAGRPAAAATESTIRVDVGLLDRLMNLVGELVLSRNGILQRAATSKDLALAGMVQRLNSVTSELQEGVMKARMQPIGNLWNRFPRLVRDLALGRGKKVRLVLEGEGTELDRTILEAIGDPLVHLLRNSVDHGIETPALRTQKHKAEEGRIRLRAFHEGGQVVIELTDDGAGIDTARLRAKALEAGLLTSERAARLSDEEAVNLVFIPGLSTAEKVTDLSGRGVGMDVVKANIERIGGAVEIESQPGESTTTRMRIPLTLAIIPALIILSDHERYAIPQVGLQELVRLEGADAARLIESIHDAPVLRLRGRLLPLVRLSRIFGRSAPDSADAVSIVVLKGRDRAFGLIVDEILDTQEIVVKPISRGLKDLDAYSGATILGDGRVALILDGQGLARRAGIGMETGARLAAEEAPAPAAAEPIQRLLLVRGTDDGRMALPVDSVARLEEFPRSAIERAGIRDVVQYRGRILPLVDLATALPERRSRTRSPSAESESATVPVIVVSRGPRMVGLVVQGILDIVEENLGTLRPSSRPGVLRCAVIRERVTELLDLDELLKDLDGSPLGEALPGAGRPS
jgi:two-component system chemotaxis sensor kinase CheA